MTDTELLLAVLRKLVIENEPCWFEPDLLYVDEGIYVTSEERDALHRLGVEPWTDTSHE